jgi:DNA-binding NarL/FixJ family response regulator
VRVVIGEDETLLRAGLRLVLEQSGFEVVAEAGDGAELLAHASDHEPDLVITDIRMPPSHTDEGIRAALEIRRRLPEVGVVVLSQHVQRRYAVELLTGGAQRLGYLLKQRITDVATFTADLRRVAEGGTALDPDVVALMVARSHRDGRGVDRLTDRQREVLALMAEGCSNAAIAARLSISEKAVVQHCSHIYDQLGLPVSEHEHRRVLAVVSWLSGPAPAAG